jgi:hypothetical protein
MISVKIFQKGINLGRFRFEVDPTQTPARLHLEHRIHISGWLWAVWCKVEDGAVEADAVGRTVTTVQRWTGNPYPKRWARKGKWEEEGWADYRESAQTHCRAIRYFFYFKMFYRL